MRAGRARGTAEHGQATVELALALPVVVALLLLVLQVGLIARSQLLVTNGAREGARTAAVGGSAAEVAATVRATPGLDPTRVDVEVGSVGTRASDGRGAAGSGSVRVTVRYRSPTDVALLGNLLGDIGLTSTVVMRREDPGPDGGADGGADSGVGLEGPAP